MLIKYLTSSYYICHFCTYFLYFYGTWYERDTWTSFTWVITITKQGVKYFGSDLYQTSSIVDEWASGTHLSSSTFKLTLISFSSSKVDLLLVNGLLLALHCLFELANREINFLVLNFFLDLSPLKNYSR